jgi:hypothetical protein
MGSTWPDAIDKAKLFHALKAQKSCSINQFLLAWTKWYQVVEAVAYDADRLFIGQQGRACRICPGMLPIGTYNDIRK